MERLREVVQLALLLADLVKRYKMESMIDIKRMESTATHWAQRIKEYDEDEKRREEEER